LHSKKVKLKLSTTWHVKGWRILVLVGTRLLLKIKYRLKPCLDFPLNAKTRHTSLQGTQLIPDTKYL